MIRVEGIWKTFGSVQAAKDVSFEVSKSEIVGLLGPNGAGKTTTMRIITGFLYADRGKVFVKDINIEERPEIVKREIGYLPEDNPLYEDITPYELLLISGKIYGMDGRRFKERLKTVVDQTGIKEVLTRPIGDLSKGFRQRVGLARALLHDPSILILDEPTSGLDPHQILEIRNLIKELAREKTVLLSTHIMQEVQAVCSSVIIINKGEIVARGTPDELSIIAKGGNLLHVTFKGDEKEIRQKLQSLTFLEDIKFVGKEDEASTFVLRGPENRDIREEIFNFAKDYNFPILEMRREKATLEEVFLRLTGGEA